MSISVTDLLSTANRVIEEGVIPNVTDKYSRTQLLAVMQALDLALELHENQGLALYLQNAELHALCEAVEEAIEAHPVAGLDEKLRCLMASVRPEGSEAAPPPYTRVSQLADINAELRTCFATIWRILCRPEFRHLPAYQSIRVRAREVFSGTYGLELAYRPVWVA